MCPPGHGLPLDGRGTPSHLVGNTGTGQCRGIQSRLLPLPNGGRTSPGWGWGADLRSHGWRPWVSGHGEERGAAVLLGGARQSCQATSLVRFWRAQFVRNRCLRNGSSGNCAGADGDGRKGCQWLGSAGAPVARSGLRAQGRAHLQAWDRLGALGMRWSPTIEARQHRSGTSGVRSSRKAPSSVAGVIPLPPPEETRTVAPVQTGGTGLGRGGAPEEQQGGAVSRIPGLALRSSATPCMFRLLIHPAPLPPEFVISPRPEPRVRTRGYSPRPRWGHGKYAIAGRA